MPYNFDRVADRYDATRGFPPGVADRICQWTLARLPADPAVAEIGVGTGRVAFPFIARGVRYSGFDISEPMLARLREKLGDDLRRSALYIADVTKPLPVPDQSQDAVIAVHILHLVDAVQALHQVRRILKPHGALAWGFNENDSTAPTRRLRPKFFELVTQLGGPQRRDFQVQPARELLAQWGAQVSRHTVAAWQETSTMREALASLQERVFSFSWDVPEAIFAEAYRRTEAWALAECGGDLDRPCEHDVRFVVDWYQF